MQGKGTYVFDLIIFNIEAINMLYPVQVYRNVIITNSSLIVMNYRLVVAHISLIYKSKASIIGMVFGIMDVVLKIMFS